MKPETERMIEDKIEELKDSIFLKEDYRHRLSADGSYIVTCGFLEGQIDKMEKELEFLKLIMRTETGTKTVEL